MSELTTKAGQALWEIDSELIYFFGIPDIAAIEAEARQQGRDAERAELLTHGRANVETVVAYEAGVAAERNRILTWALERNLRDEASADLDAIIAFLADTEEAK